MVKFKSSDCQCFNCWRRYRGECRICNDYLCHQLHEWLSECYHQNNDGQFRPIYGSYGIRSNNLLSRIKRFLNSKCWFDLPMEQRCNNCFHHCIDIRYIQCNSDKYQWLFKCFNKSISDGECQSNGSNLHKWFNEPLYRWLHYLNGQSKFRVTYGVLGQHPQVLLQQWQVHIR